MRHLTLLLRTANLLTLPHLLQLLFQRLILLTLLTVPFLKGFKILLKDLILPP